MADTKKNEQKKIVTPEKDYKREYELLLKQMEERKERTDKHDPDEFFDRNKLTRKVTGLFRFVENKGGKLKWADRFPWKGARVERYEAIDNQVITLPYYVAERLMEKGKVPVFTVTRDSDRRPVQKIKEWRRRFEFFPYDADLQQKFHPDIIQVTNV